MISMKHSTKMGSILLYHDRSTGGKLLLVPEVGYHHYTLFTTKDIRLNTEQLEALAEKILKALGK